MAIGALDANGVWIYGEDDPASPVSDLLNLGMDSVSDAVGDAGARLTTLETRVTGDAGAALTLGAGWTSILASGPSVSYLAPGGFVVVQGLIRRTGATITNGQSGTIATLAAGHRPADALYVTQARAGGQVTLVYSSSGTISAETAGTWTQNSSFVSLLAVFRAA